MMLETISTAIARFGLTARTTGESVSIYDAKGRLTGTVAGNGTVERKYNGKQALMGALVRDAIVAALAAVK